MREEREIGLEKKKREREEERGRRRERERTSGKLKDETRYGLNFA